MIGGSDTGQTAEADAGMARAAREAGAIGLSIYAWSTTPPSAWPSVTGYAGQGC